MTAARILPGLPPYGPPVRPFPPGWAKLGAEGVVVELEASDGGRWVANLRPGAGLTSSLLEDPERRRLLVAARGDIWAVDPDGRTAETVSTGASNAWPVSDPDGFVLDWQGLSFERLGLAGSLWRTRRLSWDGFDQVTLTDASIQGVAYNPVDDCREPFTVDLATGASSGGSFPQGDPEGWERLRSS